MGGCGVGYGKQRDMDGDGERVLRFRICFGCEEMKGTPSAKDGKGREGHIGM